MLHHGDDRYSLSSSPSFSPPCSPSALTNETGRSLKQQPGVYFPSRVSLSSSAAGKTNGDRRPSRSFMLAQRPTLLKMYPHTSRLAFQRNAWTGWDLFGRCTDHNNHILSGLLNGVPCPAVSAIWAGWQQPCCSIPDQRQQTRSCLLIRPAREKRKMSERVNKRWFFGSSLWLRTITHCQYPL